jgi:hypothetical protein
MRLPIWIEDYILLLLMVVYFKSTWITKLTIRVKFIKKK